MILHMTSGQPLEFPGHRGLALPDNPVNLKMEASA